MATSPKRRAKELNRKAQHSPHATRAPKRKAAATPRRATKPSLILGRDPATGARLASSTFPAAQWVYLSNPVPQVVANRAAALLHTPGLYIGMAWIEFVTVDCKTTTGLYSQILRYTCENHGNGITGISV